MGSALFPVIVAVKFVSQVFFPKWPNIICAFNVGLWGGRN